MDCSLKYRKNLHMKFYILRNEGNLIVQSGFEKFSPYAIEEQDIHKYTINDCYLQGTEFQIEVWKAIASIPLGKTVTYGELVKIVGRGSPQAAGTACGKNKIPVVIPCHRIVGKTNPLAYSGGNGAETKRQLLSEEGVRIP
jgi:O-6-methylguanine DNA methyltransferase